MAIDFMIQFSTHFSLRQQHNVVQVIPSHIQNDGRVRETDYVSVNNSLSMGIK